MKKKSPHPLSCFPLCTTLLLTFQRSSPTILLLKLHKNHTKSINQFMLKHIQWNRLNVSIIPRFENTSCITPGVWPREFGRKQLFLLLESAAKAPFDGILKTVQLDFTQEENYMYWWPPILQLHSLIVRFQHIRMSTKLMFLGQLQCLFHTHTWPGEGGLFLWLGIIATMAKQWNGFNGSSWELIWIVCPKSGPKI